ncbi:ubiquitin-conjugating enzyme E2 [Sporobolomyces salmoneus]|uniref:ubiquitin-conjugating enzyme E2 n=1 Tax=Sporobolomyces salmoneus TaxID=183962 RepID=UPI003172F40B
MAALSKRSAGVRRLLQEASELSNDDSPDYNAAPLESDLFDWHFTIRGLSGSQFEGGIYHGRMILPSEYPFKPPEIYLLTPSGRFEVNRKICLSISSFHPETWQPSWGVRTALLALISFFESDPKGAVGSLSAPPEERKRLATASQRFKCSTCGYDAAEHESFSALPLPAAPTPPTTALTEEKTETSEVNEEESELVPETEEPSEVNSRSSTPPLPEEQEPVVTAVPPSIPPTTIFPATPSAPRNHSPPTSNLVPSSIPDSTPSTSPPHHRSTELSSSRYRSVPSPVTPPPQNAVASPISPPARQPPHTPPTRTTPPLPHSVYTEREFIEAGPPSYIDRAILATLLAIVALIVRKVA